MIIRGLTPGNMIGDRAPAERYNCEYTECPSCGGQMKKTAQRCYACYSRDHNTFGPIARADAQDRKERFDLALAAGWTLEEIYGSEEEEYSPEIDRLPTRREIVARLIENWWTNDS